MGLDEGHSVSVPFTNPSGAAWQTLFNEITLAYSERRQSIAQPAYVPTEKNVQPASYWSTLQGWLEAFCKSFVDHDNGPLSDAGNALLYFTLDNWRATSGLNVNGFRRSTDGYSFSYGLMRAGDIIGPWIFEDLQKGFGALRWTGYIPEKCLAQSAGRGPIYPNVYPDDVPHSDNPWIFSKIKGVALPVDVYSFSFNVVDDFCRVNGVMKQSSRTGWWFQNGLLFSLNGNNSVTIEAFDTAGGDVGFHTWLGGDSIEFLAKWNFTNQ